jgi:hypothetical protein
LFDKSDPSILWVSAAADESGNGTFDAPFSDIDRALAIVKPGNTIVLKPGKYSRTVSVQVSGTLRQPIRIVGENGAAAVNAWFFYDVNNLIVSRIGFRDTPHGAISVIGACSHNRFEDLTFIDCGVDEQVSCTLFFGGSGGACNVVENCWFERRAAPAGGGGSSIALMVAEGDNDSGTAITDHVFRKNNFVNYTTGIVVGAGDAPAGQYGHLVEYNTVDRCFGDALIIKCGDTMARGNLVQKCAGAAIAVRAGSNSVVEANRIIDSAEGISVNGAGHTVQNNCLIRCLSHGIHVRAAQETEGRNAAISLFIENNTFVNCGMGEKGSTAANVAIGIEKGTSGIVRKNLFSGNAVVTGGQASFVVKDNGTTGKAGDGVEAIAVAFKDPAGDDYTNDSGYGASGWMLKPEAYDPHGDDIEGESDYCHAVIDDEEGEAAPDGEEPGFESFMERFYAEGAGPMEQEDR